MPVAEPGLAGVGDVDGDGYDDIVLGSEKSAGDVYLFNGPVTGEQDLAVANAIFVGISTGNQFVSVAGAGDLDRDGFDDLLLGAPAASGLVGVGYLLYGPQAGTVDVSGADARFFGETAEDYAGGSVAGRGDIDGDGFPDLLFSAYGDDDAGSNCGAAYLFYASEL